MIFKCCESAINYIIEYTKAYSIKLHLFINDHFLLYFL